MSSTDAGAMCGACGGRPGFTLHVRGEWVVCVSVTAWASARPRLCLREDGASAERRRLAAAVFTASLEQDAAD